MSMRSPSRPPAQLGSLTLAVHLALMAPLVLLAMPCAAFAAPHPSAQDRHPSDVHLRLDTDASWGIGSQMFLGGQLNLHIQLPVWRARQLGGTFDLGFRGAYGNEPAFLAPWRDSDDSDLAQRFQTQLGLGHTLHLGKQRRFALGTHVWAGWNHYRKQVTVDFKQENVSGKAQTQFNHFLVTGEFSMAYRLHDNVGINLAVGAPFPTLSSYILTLLHANIGFTFYMM